MCMYVSKFAFVHACLYVTRVCTMYASTWVCACACMYMHKLILIHTYTWPNESTYIYEVQYCGRFSYSWMYACMYVIYEMYVGGCKRICSCMYLHVSILVYVCMYPSKSWCICCMHACINVCNVCLYFVCIQRVYVLSMYECGCVCIYACLYIQTYIYLHTYT